MGRTAGASAGENAAYKCTRGDGTAGMVPESELPDKSLTVQGGRRGGERGGERRGRQRGAKQRHDGHWDGIPKHSATRASLAFIEQKIVTIYGLAFAPVPNFQTVDY